MVPGCDRHHSFPSSNDKEASDGISSTIPRIDALFQTLRARDSLMISTFTRDDAGTPIGSCRNDLSTCGLPCYTPH